MEISLYKESNKKNKQYFSLLCIILTVLAIVMLLCPNVAYAVNDNNNFFKMFDEREFTGRNDYIYTYAGFIITFTRWLLSIIGILIMSFIIVRTGASYLFLLAPDFWDNIHNLREEKSGGGSQGSGGFLPRNEDNKVDWAQFFLSKLLFLIDVKNWSDFSGETYEKMGENGYPLISEYFKQNIIKSCVILMLGGAMFMGSLPKLMSNISKGGVAVIDKLASIDIQGRVRHAMETDRDYVFAYPQSDVGKNKQSLARKMYACVKDQVPDNKTQEFLQGSGAQIKAKVDAISLGNVGGMANTTLSFKVYAVQSAVAEQVSSKNADGVESGIKVFKISDLVSGQGKAQYNANANIVVEWTARDVYDSSIEKRGVGNTKDKAE